MARRLSFVWLRGILLTLAARVLDLFLPPRCVGCAARKAWLCPRCAADLPGLPEHRCRVCAAPLRGMVKVCPACYREPPPVERINAALLHADVARQLVLGLKYQGWRHLAPLMAELLIPIAPAEVDLVVPVPLHAARLRERGFNQSELLATDLARRIARPLSADAIERTRHTESQTGLSPAERAENVRGAFRAQRRLTGQRVLLVDDVCTTGATLYACARALRRAGAANVEAIVFTRATYGVIDA